MGRPRRPLGSHSAGRWLRRIALSRNTSRPVRGRFETRLECRCRREFRQTKKGGLGCKRRRVVSRRDLKHCGRGRGWRTGIPLCQPINVRQTDMAGDVQRRMKTGNRVVLLIQVKR